MATGSLVWPESAPLISDIVARRRETDSRRAILLGISGIDGSGKSYIARQLTAQLTAKGLSVAALSADDWLDIPTRWNKGRNPEMDFYEHGIRFSAMFGELIDPLVQRRSIDVKARRGGPDATVLTKHRFRFDDIDVVLLEGIFLFKQQHRCRFDLKIWTECSFETALHRALGRGQEGLSPAETKRAFESIYFPAQRRHLEVDHPIEVADYLLVNDDQISAIARAC